SIEPLDLAKHIVEVASDQHASDILMLDLQAVSPIADYFVICSAGTQRQIDAVQEDIVRSVRKAEPGRAPRKEGKAASGWVLLDYGDVVVHILAPDEREYYALEELWEDARSVVRIQ